ncbi:molybdopterin-dependent oxidoreductase, partial [Desulfobacterales bacterium HSG17]|nr:molybdopterin-dependent oxidoreductase [Desulfobacterales bacterium HSG17]
MKSKKRKDVEKFVETQRVQLGLDESEAQSLLQQSMMDEDDEFDLSEEEFDLTENVSAKAEFSGPSSKARKRRKNMSDPYLSESQTIKARPSKVSKIGSLFYEMALPNEYIVQIGINDAKPVLGGKYFKIGKRFLKFPATVQTVYFTSDNANRNYQGLRIDGYACWRIDPEKPDVAARTLDFTDRDNPMGNTNRILRTICTEAIRHIIANITIEDALTKKDEIGLDLKSQLERIEREWGIRFDQIGIERVTILSSSVFNDLQQKTRDGLRLSASESRMETDQTIQKKKSEHSEEIEKLQCKTEKEARILRALTESETHKVELDEKAKRETEERTVEEARKKSEKEAAERSAVQQAERDKRQAVREAEVEALKQDETHKLEIVKAESKAEIQINQAETSAKISEAQAQGDLIKAEAEHKKALRKQELEAEREFQALEKEQKTNQYRLEEELKTAAKRFEQVVYEQREHAKTGCVLCAQNCGLEVFVEQGKMDKVRGDKANPRSQGYVCRKGLNVMYHQYPADRLSTPLKRVNERFEPISWDQAIEEIAEKLQTLLGKHGPRCLAYMGGGAQGGHMEAGFGLSLLRALGSQYYYSSAGQEFSGSWWVNGRMLGKQYNVTVPDEHASEILLGWGWNGMQSHQMPRAPVVLKEFCKNPEKLLVVVDPRKSETAAIADIHLPVRPGTDALLARAMIAIILKQGWENQAFLDTHVQGWEQIRPWFENFDISKALKVCRLDIKQVQYLCQMLTTRPWCFHTDLGIYMGRHSTLNSYLINILGAVCGILGVRGGNIIPGMVMPMGFHADERNSKVWRTTATNMPPVAAGAFPPSVMPEEICNEHPERLRAVLVSACNPLRSYPDTQAYEKAFKKLDLLVVNDIVLSETARLAHYVLPGRTFYESWDATFFPWTYPEVYFQVRRPVASQPEKCMESSQIFTRLADQMGLIPEIPEELQEAAKGNRMAFGAKLMEYAAQNPEFMQRMPFILAKTLGMEWDSASK